MKLVRWKRFTWELTKLPPLESTLPAHFVFRDASRDEEKIVSHLVFTAFSLEMAWSDALKIFRDRLEAQMHLSFEREGAPAIVITHGPRIIAASVLSTEADAESHLISGPCVLPEYCNRGLGTALLHHCLAKLKGAGLIRASAVTKENVPASKFLYPKFGSSSASHEYEPMLVVT